MCPEIVAEPLLEFCINKRRTTFCACRDRHCFELKCRDKADNSVGNNVDSSTACIAKYEAIIRLSMLVRS